MSLATISLWIMCLGGFLVIVGLVMAIIDWRNTPTAAGVEPNSLGELFSSLAKLIEAIKGYPTGQRIMLFGIVLIVLGFVGIGGAKLA